MPDLTPVQPTGIRAAGKVGLFFFPAIANLNAPTLTELQAGINLSKIVYAWDPNGSQDKEESARYASAIVGSSLGGVKYDPAAIEYDYDPQNPDAATGEYKHYANLEPYLTGVLGDRRGLTPDVAIASNQVWDLYPAQLGERLRIPVDVRQSGEMLRVRQAIAIIGDPALDIKITG